MSAESVLLNRETFTLEQNITATITHKKIPLHLRTSFGTSHSSTTIRYNSFIQIIINDQNSKNKSIYGIGESGLPPKKPGCYLADCEDIKSYLSEYFTYLKTLLSSNDLNTKINLYQKTFENLLKSNVSLPNYIYILFYAMDNCPANNNDYSKAAHNCLEGALWDLSGKLTNLPVYELLKITIKNKKPTFYTVGISNDDEMIQSLNLGLKYTHHIKIKLNHDIEKAKHILNLIDNKCKEYENNKNIKCIWSIDLNSDFQDPEHCLKLIKEVLLNYKERIYMLEQPFPVKFDDIEKNINGWKEIKNFSEKNNLLIYADESASTIDSIEKLKDIVSGINIKLEKCGGIRNGLKCAEKANELGLKIWIGCMVGSSLLMNMGATLTPLSTFSDLDGGLLVTEESQPGKGGFIWNEKEGVIELSKDIGFGVVLKNENNEL